MVLLWRYMKCFKIRELNVGTVPAFKMHNVGTVPTSKMHNIGTVPTFKMYNIGTVPTFEMRNVSFLILFCLNLDCMENKLWLKLCQAQV